MWVLFVSMKLKDFIKTIRSEEERVMFARRCGTSFGYLKMVSYGVKPCGPRLAVAIEEFSERKVTRPELREDWSLIWPELRTSPPQALDVSDWPRKEEGVA